MTGKFKVEDNIPIAKKAVARNRSPLREALSGLEIGQCVTVHPEEGQTLKQLRGRLSGLTQGAKEDNPGAAFIHRTVDTEEGPAVRIWRVAPEDAPAPVAKKKAASKKKAAAKVEDPPEVTLQDTEGDRDPAFWEPERNEDEGEDPFGGELDSGDEEQDEICSTCGMDLNLEGKCDNEDCEECEDYRDPFGDDED